jgi:hypothetical protein
MPEIKTVMLEDDTLHRQQAAHARTGEASL